MKILLSLSSAMNSDNFFRAFRSPGAELVPAYLGSYASAFDALILGGGGDVAPRLSDDAGLFCGVDRDRDDCELGLLAAFCAAKKPVLGICRGHQLINVFFGGTLIPHLGSALHTSPDADVLHQVIAGEGFVRDVYGERFTVASRHHQATDLEGVGLETVCRAPDGVKEAARHVWLPVWSVQWHPERTAGGGRLFGAFLEKFTK